MFWERLIAPERKSLAHQETIVYITSQIEPRLQEESANAEGLTQIALLTQQGFSKDEAQALCRLHKWYQSGGSDRACVFYHLEFLRRLVVSGMLEC